MMIDINADGLTEKINELFVDMLNDMLKTATPKRRGTPGVVLYLPPRMDLFDPEKYERERLDFLSENPRFKEV